jgi:hypothetical protein
VTNEAWLRRPFPQAIGFHPTTMTAYLSLPFGLFFGVSSGFFLGFSLGVSWQPFVHAFL